MHKLDSSTWKNVTVVPIDIADRSPVSAAVSRKSSGTYKNTVWRLHVDKPDHYQANPLCIRNVIDLSLTSSDLIISFTFERILKK